MAAGRGHTGPEAPVQGPIPYLLPGRLTAAEGPGSLLVGRVVGYQGQTPQGGGALSRVRRKSPETYRSIQSRYSPLVVHVDLSFLSFNVEGAGAILSGVSGPHYRPCIPVTAQDMITRIRVGGRTPIVN